MWVLPFETPSTGAIAPPTTEQLACVDTHDTPPFATWWADLDPERRAVLLETVRGVSEDLDEHDPTSVLGAILAWLGASDAPVVVATLEDLWLETEPQNRPGTPADENFRHRGRHGTDELDDLAALDRLLRILDDARARTGTRVDT
jgi:4-alpha-glucanotransferase